MDKQFNTPSLSSSTPPPKTQNSSTPLRWSKKTKLLFLILSTIAFTTYTIYNFYYLPLSTTFPDEGRFITEATSLYETGEHGFMGKRVWEMPFTASLYALLYAITKSTSGLIVCARLLQSILLITQAFLIAHITKIIFHSEASALTAFSITLFYPFFVFYQGLLLSETLFNTFLITGIFFLYYYFSHEFKRKRFLVLANIFLLAAIYTKGSLTVLPPVLITTFVFLSTRSAVMTSRTAVISVVIFVTLMSPWWLRSYLLLGEFVPFTTNSGFVLHSGHNPLNQTGGGTIGVDVEYLPEIEQLPEYLWYKAYTQRAIDFMKEHPWKTFKLTGVKFLRFWRLYPYAEGWNSGLYKWISLLSFGVILPTAILSVYWYRQQWVRFSPLLLIIMYYTLLHMVTFASIRYRLPLESSLIVLASPTITYGLQSIQNVIFGYTRKLKRT